MTLLMVSFVSKLKQFSELDWPDHAQGQSAMYLISDLAEFASAICDSMASGRWSVALALTRLYMDRAILLATASVDPAAAERYLSTIPETADELDSVRPSVRARPEDFNPWLNHRYGRGESPEKARFRTHFTRVQGFASNWYVHPTMLGPMSSRHEQTDSFVSACTSAVGLGFTVAVDVCRRAGLLNANLEPSGDDFRA